MPSGAAALNGSGPQQVWVNIWRTGQDINGNYSDYSGEIRYYGNGNGTWTNNTQYWSGNFGGTTFSGTFTIPYANRNDSYQGLWSGTYRRYHAADGTDVAFNASASIDSDHTTIGDGTVTVTEGPAPQIPRASQPTFPGQPNVTTGTAVTVTTNRASSSFIHNIWWSFGTLADQSTGFSVQSPVNDTTVWTPDPATMLPQIPNSTSGNGHIALNTYSGPGGSYLGQKTVAFNLTAAASVKPTVSTVTLAEQTALVTSQVGAYVQGLSVLKGTVSSAGIYGSTISSSSWSAQGTSVSSGSTIALTQSGTVAIGGAATDSRGRVGTYAANITVLPYVKPLITSVQVRRADAGGALNENGISLRVDLNAAVQSLVVGTQKNTLTYKVSTRPYGTSTWTLRTNTTLAVGTVSYNSNFIVAGGANYPISSSFEVLVEVLDKFNTAQQLAVISTAAVFMHWSATGVGIGKYHEVGVLDVSGQIYQMAGKAVLDTDDIILAASQAEAVAGTNNTKFITPLTYMTNGVGRGTTTQRDAYFGVPATDAARAALANLVPAWFNTTTGCQESYYALSTISGVNAMRKAVATGWYPISGNIPICAMMRANTTVACGSGTFTAIPLDSEIINVHGMWASGAPTRITIAVAGQYSITAGGGVSGTGGGRVGNRIRLSATDIGGTLTGGMADDTSPKTSIIWQCWVGSYVEFDLFQESGGTKNSSGAPYARPAITVAYLSPPLVK